MAKKKTTAEVETGPITLVAEMARGGQYCTELAFSPDGQRLVACGYDRKVDVYDVAERKRIATNQEHTGHIDTVAISPDSTRFATVAPKVVGRKEKGGELLIWQAKNGKLLKRTALGPLAEDVAFGPLLFSPSGDQLVCVIDDYEQPEIAIIDAGTGKRSGSIEIESSGELAFSPDGKTLVAAVDNDLVLFDFPSGKQRKVIKQKSKTRAMGFSPDGKLLAWADATGVVHLLDSSTGKPLATLKEPKPDTQQVQFSADGTRLAIIGVTIHGTSQAPVRIWDVKSKKLLLTFPGRTGVESPQGFPGSCALSADLEWFANAGAKTRLWQVGA